MSLYKFLSLNLIFRSYSTYVTIKESLTTKHLNKDVLVQGWIRSLRKHKNWYFMDVVDGSCLERLQVVAEANEKCQPHYGCSVKAEGKLIKSSHKGQDVELQCSSLETIGACPEEYPFHNRLSYSPEYIREFVHLRPRTKTFGSVLRIRSTATYAAHRFFQEQGFHFIHTPILTVNDCEGAGDVFTIQAGKQIKNANTSMELNTNQSDTSTRNVCTSSLNINASALKDDMSSIPQDSESSDDEEITPANVNDEFFGSPVYLTGSAQLHLEAMASALSKVYTFGPVFRTEGQHSKVHACEFQMIEAEMAFAYKLEDILKLVENAIRSIAKSVLNECNNEISWIYEKYGIASEDYVPQLVDKPYIYMSYAEAVDILQRNSESLSGQIKFGADFAADHKRFLVKYCNNIPVFVTSIPGSISPFYMKVDENGMACCFDVLAPYGGEICSGSLRENSEDVMRSKLQSSGLENSLAWYLDLCKYGTVPHGGFGIGFDRLLQTILGVKNIRDIIPFPRRKNDCRC